MNEPFTKYGIHYFNQDETQLYLVEGDYIEYFHRDIEELVIIKVIGANHDIKEPNKVKYTGLVVSGNISEKIWRFRGLACNTRKLDNKLAKVLYD